MSAVNEFVKPASDVHTLEPAEFWQLKALSAEAALQMDRAKAAAEKSDGVFRALAQKYGFNPGAVQVTFDDSAHALLLKDA